MHMIIFLQRDCMRLFKMRIITFNSSLPRGYITVKWCLQSFLDHLFLFLLSKPIKRYWICVNWFTENLCHQTQHFGRIYAFKLKTPKVNEVATLGENQDDSYLVQKDCCKTSIILKIEREKIGSRWGPT